MLARILVPLFLLAALAAQPARADFADNARSIAVVVGNRDYRQTVPVDYAHNDADAMRDYLVSTLGYRPENVFVLRDGTLSEMTQMFGSPTRPTSGRLWRSVVQGASNVFVYYSGHGVPDLATKQPFLLPSDGDPNSADSGYRLEVLYRNLEAVKEKVGATRDVVVMIDACFTGETGRKGESLLAVSAPGFAPALPKAPGGLVKLLATSGTTPANWDDEAKLGLFTSRFLMGAAGLAAQEPQSETLPWNALETYLETVVPEAALRETGRAQTPEIDGAQIELPIAPPVPAVAPQVERARDERRWQEAQADVASLERYVAQCGTTCLYREQALARLRRRDEGEAAVRDREVWERLSGEKKYDEYLKECGSVCAYRSVAEAYLGQGDPSRDPQVARCDALAAAPADADRPDGVKGVSYGALDGHNALDACAAAARAFPGERRLVYQAGRAHDKLGAYGDAKAAYEKAAEMGSMAALNNLATLHENGEGVPSSPKAAFDLYRRAAEGGDVLAMTNVGRLLEYGRGTGKDEKAAVAWYAKAAERGDAFAITKLVPYYLSGGAGIKKNPKKGFALFEKAIEGNDPMAMATVAVLIDNGFGKHFKGRKSVDMVMRALEQGEAGSAAIVGTADGAQNLSGKTIKAVQAALAQKQFYNGKVDGTLNPLFTRALDAYARSAASQSGG